MNKKSAVRIIESSIGIDMLPSLTELPVKSGSACMIQFEQFKAIFTVAHVTDTDAGACIPTGIAAKAGWSQLFSVGALCYLAKFDVELFQQQLEELKSDAERIEERDFGQIDLSFAVVPDNLSVVQHKIDFEEQKIKVKAGRKRVIPGAKIAVPDTNTEYAFFGRIKAIKVIGTMMGNMYETMEIYYGGLGFIKKTGHYYEFLLPQPIADHADFKGTSGAPVMDSDGNVVALITHGYKGGSVIYGIALSDFSAIAEKMMLDNVK